jgi:hypothetical protein
VKKTLSILLLLAVSAYTFAQQAKAKKEIEKKGIIYNKEVSFGGYMASNGWGLFVERGKIQSIKKTRLMHWSFGELRDYSLRKQKAELGIGGRFSNYSPKDYFYGRQNNFYALRFALGQKRVLGNKAEKNGVRVSFSYMAGVSLGILKPYYLDLAYIVDRVDNTEFYEVISSKYSDDEEKFLDWQSIAGASGFRFGLKEIKPVPGGFAKTGLNFDWSKTEDFQMAMEVGIMADVYYKRVPIMVSDNKPFFLGAYIQFQFGKRKF